MERSLRRPGDRERSSSHDCEIVYGTIETSFQIKTSSQSRLVFLDGCNHGVSRAASVRNPERVDPNSLAVDDRFDVLHLALSPEKENPNGRGRQMMNVTECHVDCVY
jgi:hypothetical protein